MLLFLKRAGFDFVFLSLQRYPTASLNQFLRPLDPHFLQNQLEIDPGLSRASVRARKLLVVLEGRSNLQVRKSLVELLYVRI